MRRGTDLCERDIGPHVIEQGGDTATLEGRALLGMFGVLAELRRELFVANRTPTRRTPTTGSPARARGRVGGRRPELTPDRAEPARQLYEAREEAVQQTADMVDVPRSAARGHLDRDETVPRRPERTAAAKP